MAKTLHPIASNSQSDAAPLMISTTDEVGTMTATLSPFTTVVNLPVLKLEAPSSQQGSFPFCTVLGVSRQGLQ
jgi:hypothetical protein